ncbi:pentatricopeptide repeat-containing protein At5g02830, chloroplastic [Neltuma alba]|uniref:pentatricopeptide repeat-containing protein At5g02830, chloroplastic n=1 Tax=Neltuma alba TaxID=207710 RepID=UPI0010A44F04|nr:pentatricopeptide repeat-containing protein At5g02830, chloroplastic [Prosopis alba]
MRDFVVLGSSTVTPPNPSSPSHHNHPIKPYKSSLPKFSSSAKQSSPFSSFSSSSLSTPSWTVTNTHHQIPLKHYVHLASKLAQDANFQDFEMVVEAVLDSGVNASQFAPAFSAELLANGIRVGIRAGRLRAVIDTLKKVQELGISLSARVYGSAGDLLGKDCYQIVKLGQLEEAVELMEVLSRFQLSIRELVQPADMIKQCVHNRKPNLAVRYACLLPHAQILFCTIISEFGRMRDLTSALRAYETSKKNLTGPNMYIHRAIIDACGLCGDYQKSRYIYEDLLSQKISPNIYVFNSLMNVNAHDLNYTLDLYKNMQNLGLKPDLASYNILLKACCVAGRVDFAQEIYKEVKHLESAGVLKLDVFTYSTMIKVFADAKLWQMALKIKQDMLSAGVSPNTVAWSSLINACAHAGLVEQAIQLFEEMLLAGCEPNTQCFNIILHACVEACQYDRAFRFFQSWKGNKMLQPINGDHSINLEQGDCQSAPTGPNGISYSHILSFAERFPFTPTTTTYNILLKACGSDYYHAKALIKEMKVVGLTPNHISWSTLIDICGASGNVEGALEILKTMRDAGTEPDVVTYTTAIKVCVESKNFEQALSLYEEMKRYEVHPNLVTYTTLLRARTKYGSLHEVQQCLAIYQDMRKSGYKANDYYLQELIEEWCEGVIQDDRQNQGEFTSSNKSELERPQSILLEKIAAHLQKRVADILAIDVQGLTKVEARLVILAVLRMIKENCGLGHSVNNDILIIIGATKADATPAKHILVVQDTITKLLQDELELEVMPARTRFALDDTVKLENHVILNPSLEAVPGKDISPTSVQLKTRRPAVLQRLRVTKKSLHDWLRRKVSNNRQDLIYS